MNSHFLLHLIFADDIVIFSHSLKQLQRRIEELVTASSTIGLKVNIKKTKTMMNFPGTAALSISGQPIEEVNEFIYLVQLVSFPCDHYKEIKRCVQAGWNAYRKYKHFLTAPTIAMKLKRWLFNMVIVPTMLYGAETWALMKQAETRLATTQYRMEWWMIGVRILDHRSNEWLRGVTKVVNIVKAA
uniref:Reverse transcriptase domain-containing protein n=1 Tax=Plectus sambesii TaxID=2011161 RepID=A0A914UUZ6_9BILA